MCNFYSIFDCFQLGCKKIFIIPMQLFQKHNTVYVKGNMGNLWFVKLLYSWFEAKESHPIQRFRVLKASLVEGTFCAYSFFTVSSDLSPAISGTPVTFTFVKPWPRSDGSTQETDDEDRKQTVLLIPSPVFNHVMSCLIHFWASSLLAIELDTFVLCHVGAVMPWWESSNFS